MNEQRIIAESNEILVDILHRLEDPGVWIVRHWKKILWFKRKMSFHWFNNEQQAVVFAKTLR